MKVNLEQYLNAGIQSIIKDIVRSTLKNPRESAFIAKFAVAVKKAEKLRENMASINEHIPPFLIASITSECNLHCAGCYARANNSCKDALPANQLDDNKWGDIFSEATELGISFILLAGGEPLMRQDVLEQAAKYQSILFPIFTNGTMINTDYIQMFSTHRNLIPILSIEGDAQITDERRGHGVYNKLLNTMHSLKNKGVLFGASVTVTKQNLAVVTDDVFLNDLKSKGCKVVIFVEYVPIDSNIKNLTICDDERAFLTQRLDLLRQNSFDMVLISFPGDELASGGCLAAGRGFFHINSHGGAEPCPFSPYSDTNLKNCSLREALKSPLFLKLNSEDVLSQTHEGGCVLFQQEDKVKELLSAL